MGLSPGICHAPPPLIISKEEQYHENLWSGSSGLRLGAYKDGKLKYVATVKGFSDDIQETIKNTDLSNVVVEIEYQGIQNKERKSLRHPRFKQFRFDKESNECLWDNVGCS